jgi:tetratricopeptide (TPR) repeat protein
MWEDNNRKAVELFQTGKHAEALELVQKALKQAEKELGSDDPSVARCLNNLAEMYRAQGNLEQALPLWERSLEIRQKTLGPQHAEVAIALNNL